MWEVYVIEAENGSYYTGITTDLDRRWSEHQSGRKGASFFRLSSPKAIVYRESCANRSEASKREAAIKKLSRKQKERLVEGAP